MIFPALLGPLGLPEILLILFIVILLFGPKKLPQLGKSIGETVKELRKAQERDDEEEEEEEIVEEVKKPKKAKSAKVKKGKSTKKKV